MCVVVLQVKDHVEIKDYILAVCIVVLQLKDHIQNKDYILGVCIVVLLLKDHVEIKDYILGVCVVVLQYILLKETNCPYKELKFMEFMLHPNHFINKMYR